jgi:hypothetical protein
MPNITNKDCERKVAKQEKLFDEKCSGLYVSVSPKGAMFNFKYFDRQLQKQRTVEVGPYVKDKFTVVEARIKGDDFRSRAAGGESLVETLRRKEIEAQREGKTVDDIITGYVEWIKTPVQKADGEMRPRIETWEGTEGYLRRFTSKALGTRRGSSVENDDIANVSNDIVAGMYGKASISNARNFRSCTSAMFEWAAEAGRKWVKMNSSGTACMYSLPRSMVTSSNFSDSAICREQGTLG